ncbi:hypothetical protein M431DRAFT_206054 [Trichoderma harzianum CBS 226.95]|uniref:Uncharacterized protein n=1 Tax=Trichoderma harzianum CBS 226.95 TaxID=983964 RepID=A0A2T4AVZ0_TRIHA|nr:hypothetical protein M431DRAFT_206054 [Trichoderma harzianum CBS 226.95]PTB61211.1 hypothetical protein M431DRAFT_206054 [Trichoderma harzianum CBS 226.95]
MPNRKPLRSSLISSHSRINNSSWDLSATVTIRRLSVASLIRSFSSSSVPFKFLSEHLGSENILISDFTGGRGATLLALPCWVSPASHLGVTIGRPLSSLTRGTHRRDSHCFYCIFVPWSPGPRRRFPCRPILPGVTLDIAGVGWLVRFLVDSSHLALQMFPNRAIVLIAASELLNFHP